MTEQALQTEEPDNLPVPISVEYGTGLEDMNPDDVQIPRIKINHAEQMFVDGLTGEEFPQIHGILLGMVKQRVMFYPVMEEGSRPQCKSNDAEVAYPNTGENGGRPEDLFPWAVAGLDPNSADRDKHGRVILACKACPFAKWTGTRAKPIPPKCGERHTYPVMYSIEEGGPLDRAGIVSFKGSGIKPSRNYLSGFVRTKTPVYAAYTSIGLKYNKRGMTVYSSPEFTRTGNVAEELQAEVAPEYASLREYLRRPPFAGDGDDELEEGAAATVSAPQPTAQPVPAHIPVQRTAPSTAQSPAANVMNQAAAATPAAPVANPAADDLPW